MKRVLTLICLCFVCISLTSICFSAEFENPPITDKAGYLTESELEELSLELEKIREKYNFDVAIVTENEMTSQTAQASADDIFDYGGFGAGEKDDGILFYICKNERNYHFSTHAYGIEVFNVNGIEYLKKNIEPYLKDDDYSGAMREYIKLSEKLLEMAKNGEPFNEKQYDMEFILIVVGCALFVPVILAWALMKRKLSKMKTAVKNDYAANYMIEGSRQLNESRDIFLYSHITKTEKAKENSSGTHTSSSGREHGGGGGSF